MTPSSPAGSPRTPDETPTLSDILGYFAGAAHLMAGRAEGLKRLDLSADGFWSSFLAMPVALPPVALSWVEFETAEAAAVPAGPDPFVTYGAHALADLLAWLLPVLVLVLVARRIGFSRKIGPLVVATNWGTALLAWATAPYWLLVMATGEGETAGMLGFVMMLASIALTVRLVSTAIGRDLPAAVAIVLLMIVASLVAYGAVMDLTGVALI